MREYFVHRSIYHLERSRSTCLGDPEVDRAKASYVAVEFDEYGVARRPSGSSAFVGQP